MRVKDLDVEFVMRKRIELAETVRDRTGHFHFVGDEANGRWILYKPGVTLAQLCGGPRCWPLNGREP